MSGRDIRTARQAWQLFKLPETTNAEELRRAYRSAVRIAHPDHGGDAAALRAVIDAYRLLTELEKARAKAPVSRVPAVRPKPAEAPRPPPVQHLEITVAEAIDGGHRTVALPNGRRVKVKLPPGLRAGDKLRLNTPAGAVVLTIKHAAGALEVRGSDVWMTVSVLSSILAEGGQIEVDTPSGRKSVTVSAGAGLVGRVRLKGQGLPARGAHSQGHLFVRMLADAALDQAAAKESAARSMLRRFAASWAA